MLPHIVLRVPAQIYSRPPSHFLGWDRPALLRWGEHWGRDWEERHGNCHRWMQREAPLPGLLPNCQSQFPRERYPQPAELRSPGERHFPYWPHEIADQQILGRSPARSPRLELAPTESPPTSVRRPQTGNRGATPFSGMPLAQDRTPEIPGHRGVPQHHRQGIRLPNSTLPPLR